MYNKSNGNNFEIVQGLNCNIPNAGTVFNKFTQQYEDREIHKRSKIPKENFWQLPYKPKDLKKKLLVEKNKRIENPTYFDRDLQEYRDTEWDRRVNGFWFYNYNEETQQLDPTYITGQHYFFLAHWQIKGVYLDYKDTDRKWHYFWQYCEEDPCCYGMIEITQRREGKSSRAGNMLGWYSTMNSEKNCGIQSKTDPDAQRLFSEQLISPFKKLESFWIPEMDRSKGSTPKTILSFNQSATTKGGYLEIIDCLFTQVDFRASTESAYDGDILHRYVADECGKAKNISIYNRHTVVKPCMAVGKKIIGKMLYTTTVEDIGDADIYEQGNFQKLWDESNVNKRNELGQTISGLYRYFLPANIAIEYDVYGKPKLEANMDYLLKMRESQTSPAAKASYCRKFPITIDEAFWTPGDECIYNVIEIEKRKYEIKYIDKSDLYVQGNLVWLNNKRGSGVRFVESDKGRLKFHKKFNVHAETLLQNTLVDYDGKFKPKMKHLRCIGIDPFDHGVIEIGGRGSRAAAYLYFKYNPMDELSETFICEYLRRPNDLEEFHEDMCKLAFLTGADVIIENNKQLLINHFKETGFEKFLYHHNTTPGIAANEKTHELLAKTTEIYIEHNINNVNFENILQDWSKFNLKKTTKFDAAMGAGYALIGGYQERMVAINELEKPKPVIYESKHFT
ncbi:MAG: hypothetical protein ACRCSG_05560 [Cellulosilyticaceae bacterium]